MANVLTNLAADIYVAADRVSRELVGFIPSVTMNGGSERAAIGDTVRSAFTRSVSLVNRTVAMTIAEGTDQTVDNKTVTISNDKAVNIPYTGEDIKHLNNGSGFETVYGDQIMQAMRAFTNQIESDIWAAAYAGASRAYGTAGTTPFATAGDFTDASETLRILKDNGQAGGDNSLLINTAAGAKFIGLQSRADIAGGTEMQRQGVLLALNGLNLRESAAIGAVTAGAMASATTTAAALTVGQTVLPLATAGTGVVAAGDIITLANDTNKYVVTSVSFAGANPASGDSITIAAPGLRVAQASAARAITVVATSTRNIALARSAVELVARAPAVPVIGGVARDAAVDRMTIVDPRSGLPYEVSVYLGQGKAMIQVAMAWGVKVWKPEGVAVLLG